MPHKPSLLGMERWLQEAVRNYADLDAFLLGNKFVGSNDLANFVVSDSVSIFDRLNIYAQGYFIRLCGLAKEIFPSVLRIIGHEEFDKMVKDYLNIHPSRCRNIAEVFHQFPDFIKGMKGCLTKYPFLADLTCLDFFAFSTVFEKPAELYDLKGLGKFAEEDWPNVVLFTNPSLQFLAFDWSVYKIWQGHSSRAERNEETILAYRLGASIQIELISKDEFKVLQRMQEPSCLEEITEFIHESLPSMKENSQLITEWFQNWLQSGIITDLRLRIIH